MKSYSEMDHIMDKAKRSKAAYLELEAKPEPTPKQALDAAIFAAVEKFEADTGCSVEIAEYCSDNYAHKVVVVRSK